MPLGDHLGADEHLDLAAVEALQERRGPAGPAGRVAVEHVDADVREQLLEVLLHPLGAGADRLQRLLGADRAARGRRDHRAAVVADEPAVPPVVGARQAAVRAAEVLAAGAAEQHRRVAAAVAQQDDLVAVRQGLADLEAQPLREVDLARPARDPLLPQIDQDPLGERALARPLR